MTDKEINEKIKTHEHEIKKLRLLLLDNKLEKYKQKISVFIKKNFFVYDGAFIKTSDFYSFYLDQNTSFDLKKNDLYSLVEELGYIKVFKSYGQCFTGFSDIEDIDKSFISNKIKSFIDRYMYTGPDLGIPVNDMYRIVNTHIDKKLNNKDISNIMVSLGYCKKTIADMGYCFNNVSIVPAVYVEGQRLPLRTINEIKVEDINIYNKIIQNAPILHETRKKRVQTRKDHF